MTHTSQPLTAHRVKTKADEPMSLEVYVLGFYVVFGFGALVSLIRALRPTREREGLL